MSNIEKPIRQEGFKSSWQTGDVEPTIQEDGYYAMRGWQQEAFDVLKDASHMILNAPMGSGKSWMMCFLSSFKMNNNPLLRCIIAMPQTIIVSGFLDEKLQMPDGTKVHWKSRHNLCRTKSFQGTVKYIINWLKKSSYESPDDRVLLCTHATLVKTYRKLEADGQLELLNNLLLWVDEAHHVKNISVNNAEDIVIGNALGDLVRSLLNRTDSQVEIGLTTASFFRGDRGTLLTPSMEESFKRFNLPYDDYLRTMVHLESFSFDFLLCGYDYTKAIGVLAKQRVGKDIIYIPHPVSRYSTHNKNQEVQNIINEYQNIHGGIVSLPTDEGLIVVSGGNRYLKILDLVDETNRLVKKEFINSKVLKEHRDSLDIIFALGMFKEGANWIWADRSIIVGVRTSLVDVIQMIGRLFRDAPDKKHVEVIQLLPFTLDQKNEDFQENLNDYLKAIYASLILEDILEPIKIKAPLEKNRASEVNSADDVVSTRLSDLVPDESIRHKLLHEVTQHLSDVTVLSNKEGSIASYSKYQDGLPDVVEKFGITDRAQVQAIGEHIWRMWLRRSINMRGISSRDIDFTIVYGVDPLEGLLRYTSNACGIDTFEGLREAIHKSYNWRTYEGAREWVLSLDLQSETDWRRYISGQMSHLPPLPDDIPRAPWVAYKDSGWINWGHFLGTDTVAPRLRKYRSYDAACEFVHSLGLKKKEEWFLYAKGKMPHLPPLPSDIPSSPSKTYSREEYGQRWTRWGDFLGTGKIGPKERAQYYLSYEDAQAFVVLLNLKSSTQWRKYLKGEYSHLPSLPINIPKKPDEVYENFSWPLFLGYSVSKMDCTREFFSFNEARDFVRKLGLKRQKDWHDYCAGRMTYLPPKPLGIPSNPSKKYKNQGWIGWKDWLGYAK